VSLITLWEFFCILSITILNCGYNLYAFQRLFAKMAKKEMKTGRKGKKVKPMKIAALVVSAIQDLRETKGSTPKKIIGYISYTSSMPEQRVKRQVSGFRIFEQKQI